jgi:hypothetical protein
MSANVSRDFAAAGRMAHVNHFTQIERFDNGREIVGVCVHVVAIPRLARSPMATAVMCDASIAVIGQEHHLVFKGIGVEGPTMTEKDRLSNAPVLVVNLRSVFDCNSWHRASFLIRLYAFNVQ